MKGSRTYRIALVLVFSLVSVAGVAGAASAAGAAGAFDLESGRSYGLGGATLLSDPSALDLINMSAIQTRENGLKLELGLQRRYQLSELDQAVFGAVYRRRWFSVGLGFQQMGKSSYYSEKTVRSSLVFHFRRLSLGASISGRWYQFGGAYQTLGAGSVGLAAGAEIERILLAVRLENLNGPRLYEGAESEPRILSVEMEYLSSGAFTLSGQAEFRENRSPSLGVGQSARLSRRARMFWGVAFRPLLYGAGLEVEVSGYRLLYSGWFHPDLGYSHSASLLFDLPLHGRR